MTSRPAHRDLRCRRVPRLCRLGEAVAWEGSSVQLRQRGQIGSRLSPWRQRQTKTRLELHLVAHALVCLATCGAVAGCLWNRTTEHKTFSVISPEEIRSVIASPRTDDQYEEWWYIGTSNGCHYLVRRVAPSPMSLTAREYQYRVREDELTIKDKVPLSFNRDDWKHFGGVLLGTPRLPRLP